MKDRRECLIGFLSAVSLLLLVWDGVAFTTPSQQQHPPIRLQWTHMESRSAFMSCRPSSRLQVSDGREMTTNSTAVAAGAGEEEFNKILQGLVADAFSSKAEILTFELKEHSPLGCTVEESLNEDEDYVFISKITPGGYAEKIGLKLGDVIVGVTGLFGEIMLVMDAGVEKIKRLVSSVPEGETLQIQIVRGTDVLQRHETAVVDLCNMSGANDKEVENCVVDFLSGGFDVGVDITETIPSDGGFSMSDEDAEGLIDNMMNLWSDELPLPPTTSGITDQVNGENSGRKPKPWSSRSSGSGTYVRDPKTGQMRNIDP